jgi:hypothetical protein
VPNSFEENDCENANTRAQSGEHLLVLTHLQRRWSSVLFVEMKRLFSIAPKDQTEGEVTEVIIAIF